MLYNAVMKSALHFYKMHGLGNDFVVMPHVDLSIDQIRYIGDRHFGVGCDQLVMYREPANPSVKFYNNDGSYSEMCGNGLRCLAALLMTQQEKNEICIETDVGDRWCKRVGGGLIQVEMGSSTSVEEVRFDLNYPELNKAYYVSVGNPHVVFFMDQINLELLRKFGPDISVSAQFKNGCNVHFASILDKNSIRAVHYERGAGVTQACSSGASAIYAAAKHIGLVGGKCKVFMPGGEVTLETRQEDGMLLLTGPYSNVFEGSIILP